MTETPTTDREILTFDNDKGSNRSKWVAGGIAVAIVGWMGSGFVLPAEEQATAAAPAPAAQRAVTVAVRPSTAESVDQVFVAEGQALPDRDTPIRAETAGEISEVLVSRGADLEAGQVIARFDTATLQADQNRAQEELNRAQREFDNATALVDRGIATADRVSAAQATLAAARASLTAADEALSNSEITAPFAGRLENLDINAGEIVASGTEVGRIVDNTPLTISIQIPQQSLRDIRVGQSATVNFITGDVGDGIVRFVSTNAESATRTFVAEIEVPNADGAIPAGISAQLRIPTGEVQAHFVSPAILSLDTDGTLGIEVPQERGAGDDGDVRAKGVEDVGELHGDVATANDHQGLGQPREPHDVLVGVVPHTRSSDGLGDDGPGACGDDDLVT